MRSCRFIVALMLLVAGGSSVAQKPKANDPQMAEAKRHFDQAVALFNDGDFGAALTEFEASYRSTPRRACSTTSASRKRRSIATTRR